MNNIKDINKKNYRKNLATIKKQLSPLNQTFSNVVHAPIIDSILAFIDRTLLRPIPLLTGAILTTISMASCLILTIFGYSLSGLEFTISFSTGWLIGLIYDAIAKMAHGK